MKPDGYERIGREITVEKAAKGCLRKNRYASKNIARDMARKIAKKTGDPTTMRPYRCGLCGGWHLTSSQPRGLTYRPKSDRAA